MRAYVFTDPTLARHAGRFVWLDIDGEKARNAAVMKRLRVTAYPTLYILDPATEKVAIRWVGSATVPQLHKLLDEGRVAVSGRGSGIGSLLARADSLYGAGEDSSAAVAYDDVLARAPRDWPAYPRAVDAALFAHQSSQSYERCIELSLEAMDRLKGTPSGASAAVSGLSCALSLDAEHPRRAELVARFEARAREAIADRSLPLTVDDRSGIYSLLEDSRELAKDDAGRTQILNEWAAFLEKAAAEAKTPEQRTVFDSHRLTAYMEMKQPERAVPMLEAAERDLPDDYNPPARLAVAYLAMKEYDKALAASDRALAKSYGPRRMRIYTTRLDLQLARGDSAAAREVLVTAIREGEAMPEEQRPNRAIATFKKRLSELNGGGTSPKP